MKLKAFNQPQFSFNAQRKKQFARAEASRLLVAGAHLPFPGVGHLRAEDQGYAWVPVDYRWREP